ncbi:unnamed protein product [Rhodiola kirilowii]
MAVDVFFLDFPGCTYGLLGRPVFFADGLDGVALEVSCGEGRFHFAVVRSSGGASSQPGRCSLGRVIPVCTYVFVVVVAGFLGLYAGTKNSLQHPYLNFLLIFMSTLIHLATNLSVLNILHDRIGKRPIRHFNFPITKLKSLTRDRRRFRVSEVGFSLMGSDDKDWIFGKREGLQMKRRKMVVVRLNQGSGFNGGGGGGGGGGGLNSRVLGNLALAIGLTYLTMTGQIGLIFDAIGWVVDTLVSISLAVVILPIIGIGAFLWWAGKDVVQDTLHAVPKLWAGIPDIQDISCRSLMIDEMQSCPYCSQPFSVVEDKFVSGSNNSNPFGQVFNDFSPQSKKEKKFSSKVVDVEAEVRDVD